MSIALDSSSGRAASSESPSTNTKTACSSVARAMTALSWRSEIAISLAMSSRVVGILSHYGVVGDGLRTGDNPLTPERGGHQDRGAEASCSLPVAQTVSLAPQLVKRATRQQEGRLSAPPQKTIHSCPEPRRSKSAPGRPHHGEVYVTGHSQRLPASPATARPAAPSTPPARTPAHPRIRTSVPRCSARRCRCRTSYASPGWCRSARG